MLGYGEQHEERAAGLTEAGERRRRWLERGDLGHALRTRCCDGGEDRLRRGIFFGEWRVEACRHLVLHRAPFLRGHGRIRDAEALEVLHRRFCLRCGDAALPHGGVARRLEEGRARVGWDLVETAPTKE